MDNNKKDKLGPDYLNGLEILRFIMAMIVIIYHLAMWVPNRFTQEHLALIKYVAGYTVPVFWCLSGFVFSHKYSVAIGNKRIPFANFASARFSRLYPLSFVTLLVSCLLQFLYQNQNDASFVYHAGDAYHFILNLLMVSHWGFQRFTAFNGPLWSISVEILVYIVFFLTCRLAGRSPLIYIVMILLGKGLARIEPDLTNHLPISTCLTSFYSGCLIEVIYKKTCGFSVLKQFFTLLMIGLLILSLNYIFVGKYDLLLLVPTVVYAFQVCIRSRNVLLGQVSKFLGSLTYASYMWHFPALLASVLILDSLGVQRNFVGSPTFMCCFISIVVCWSRVSFLYFEVPAQNYLRRKWSTGR
jgi:peptidoglycan/LPS O-acetylase OafA/YrhL